jgi:hypothetical protein
MNARSPLLPGRTRLRRVAIGGAAASVLSLAIVALPSATPAWAASCPKKTLCTWVNAGYEGTEWNFSSQAVWTYVGAAANDKISSLITGTQGGLLKAWIGKDCPVGSDNTYIGMGESVENLASDKWQDETSLNDSVSAIALNSSTPPHGSRMEGGC